MKADPHGREQGTARLIEADEAHRAEAGDDCWGESYIACAFNALAKQGDWTLVLGLTAAGSWRTRPTAASRAMTATRKSTGRPQSSLWLRESPALRMPTDSARSRARQLLGPGRRNPWRESVTSTEACCPIRADERHSEQLVRSRLCVQCPLSDRAVS
ncbi:DUF6461 domain-containing protein [Streptomyces griseorubiginosus]|uniref:DUF6461 domain-containing protein n=1 Tax=Streptomyces griseorubiginosus TaxID=67304 RepID=UPI003658DE1F